MHPDTDSTETAAPASPAEDRRMPEFGRGTCVGRYVVLDRIGSGGMGVVYRAYDPDLDRRIALKLVRDLSDDATARLVREAQALAKVSHPNIVAVFDVGTFGGSVFIAMELVEGRTLSQWHRAEKPGWRVTLDHLLDAARGLAAAHAAGLIHRDFKPNNAIVGADGRVRVLDFGLARVVAADSPAVAAADQVTPDQESLSPVTALARRVSLAPALEGDASTQEDEGAGLPRVLASRIIGTPVYMAPEQRRRGVIDSRADQFAFAVTAWELLHGERPFEVTSDRTYAQASAAHLVRSPPSGTDVPAWVRRALTKALSPAPGDRYRAMDDLVGALQADPSARRWKLVGAVAVAALIAVGAATIARRSEGPGPCEDSARHLDGVWDRAATERLAKAFAATGKPYAADTAARVTAALERRARAWIDMHGEACRATRVHGEQSAELLDLRMACLERRRDELGALVGELGAGPDDARLESAVAAVDRMPDVAACADREALTAVIPAPTDPAVRARIEALRHELSSIEALMWTGKWAAARDRAVRAVDEARAIDWTPVIAEASYLRGQVDRLAGDLEAAERAQLDATAAAAHAHLDELAARAWSELVAVVGYEAARPIEGLALAHAADAAVARAGSPPMVVAGLDEAVALTLSAAGKGDEALERANQALTIVERERGADSVEAGEVLNTIAMFTEIRGDHAGGEKLHRRVLAVRERAYGAGHPKVADSLDNIGVCLHHEGRSAEARDLYERALALRIAALGPEHRDVGTSHNNLGGLLMDLGDDDAATEHLERALAIYGRALGTDHADLAIPLSNLGELATRRGDYQEALGYCERAFALDEASSGPDDPDLAYDLVCVGEAQLGIGDTAAARVVLERALALREMTSGDAGELARTRFGVAQALPASAHARARALTEAAAETFKTLGPTWAPWLARARTFLARAP